MGWTKSLLIVLSLVCLAVPEAAWADGAGVCNGRPLPKGKTRRWRNHELRCTSNSDTYVRQPIPFDVKEWRHYENLWRKLGKAEHRQKMQAIGQNQPLIQWGGQIPYQTVEHWDWTDWVYGADPVCGYDEHTTCYKDKDGQEHCTTTYTMRSCWHNEDEHESRPCSNEILPFNAEYVRPSIQQWGPSVEGYYDILPNKYDLLPGESESVQIFNTTSGWTGDGNGLAPSASVGDPWNEYDLQVRFRHGAKTAACVYGGGGYHLDVAVHTVGRIQRATPNAFRAPIDRFGREIEALNWVLGENGERAKPYELKLSDASAVLIAAMSRVSQSEVLANAKAKLGQATNVKTEDLREFQASEELGFWKDTRVRLRLKHIIPFSILGPERDVRVTANFYTRGAEVAIGANSEHYQIDLNETYQASGPLFPEFWKSFSFNFEPAQQYQFLVSMYQKGVPFYAQDCDDPETSTWWNCRLGLRGENNWYSKELPLDFAIPASAPDQRSPLQKLSDFQGKPMKRKIQDLWRSITQ
ncbi:hypothetical protein K2X33_09785 [bacterium]|nr:hypothetical protein [bacterium]